MEMHIEKPFKCNTCSARFTNEDHLQVHTRRHEMSLNLGSGTALKLPDGFVDETPTPTHLCKNLEDVGLFQDLQNINPFDAQFSKAASATPSSENNFEFNFSFPRTDDGPVNSNLYNTTSTSNNDTLNTPQILGYPPITPAVPETRTKKVLTPSQETQELIGSGKTESVPIVQLSSPKVISILKPAPADVTITDADPVVAVEKLQLQQGHGVNFNKAKTILRFSFVTPEVDVPVSEKVSPDPPGPHKKTEMLERNRAAASRSRERRKQWVSALETKCSGLQSTLAKAQAELRRVQSENLLLKEELARHAHCNLPKSPLTFQPSILRTGSVITTQAKVLPTVLPAVIQVEASPSPNPSTVIVKPKRGRPKKGEERRASTFPAISASASLEPPPRKIQILPLSALRKSSTIVVPNEVYILNATPPPQSQTQNHPS